MGYKGLGLERSPLQDHIGRLSPQVSPLSLLEPKALAEQIECSIYLDLLALVEPGGLEL